jgi:hypothetical protein
VALLAVAAPDLRRTRGAQIPALRAAGDSPRQTHAVEICFKAINVL